MTYHGVPLASFQLSIMQFQRRLESTYEENKFKVPVLSDAESISGEYFSDLCIQV